MEKAFQLQDRLAAAVDIARSAGAILRDGLSQPHTVRTKSADTDLVTEIDLQSERTVLGMLQERFPDDGILAEESGEQPGAHGLWIIDPLDGTTNYAHGIPFFSVAIAFSDPSGVRLGVVYDPIRDELFQAAAGSGASMNGVPIQVSDTPDLNRSLLTTGFPYDVRTTPSNNLDNYAALALKTQGVRRLGSAALDLAYVAAGRFDGYWEVKSFPWDVAAGMVIALEAGGQVTQITGAPIPAFQGPGGVSVMATNGRIHDALVSALGERDA